MKVQTKEQESFNELILLIMAYIDIIAVADAYFTFLILKLIK